MENLRTQAAVTAEIRGVHRGGSGTLAEGL
jgi:hypothetical protein